MNDNTWILTDHSQPCEHDIPGVDGFTWQDDSGNWICDEIGCPGGREVRALPMIRMGGLSPAWYPASPDEEPDGWLVKEDT